VSRSENTVRIGVVARRLGLSVSRVRQLADAGVIPLERTPGGHRVFDLAEAERALAGRASRQAADAVARFGAPLWERTVALAGLEEHLVWQDVARDLGLDTTTSAGRVLQYAFDEMLNNAIDHSGAATATVRWWKTPDAFAFEVADDGIGVFARLREGLGLPDDLAAIQELTKGKRTTDPVNHTGEGIFFTSKAVDVFQLSSDGIRWTVDNRIGDQSVGGVPRSRGTRVVCVVDPETIRALSDVFARFSEGFVFNKTRPVVKLFATGPGFVSRSEARRLLEGLERFTEVEVDFSGVDEVGQGFVDEVFRVWPSMHPGTRFVPTNMAPLVEFMVRRGLGGEKEGL